LRGGEWKRKEKDSGITFEGKQNPKADKAESIFWGGGKKKGPRAGKTKVNIVLSVIRGKCPIKIERKRGREVGSLKGEVNHN